MLCAGHAWSALEQLDRQFSRYYTFSIKKKIISFERYQSIVRQMDSQGPIEVALSSDLRGAPHSFSLWDIYTGAQLVVFKGNKNNPISRCLQLIDNNYFITAIDNMVQIWSIYNRKSQDLKLFLPGRPSSLVTSPCANYLIAGISEMIYVWQLCSGNLMAHTQRHYQTVNILKMNQDGTFIFSGAEDGMVLVWPFGDLISNSHNTGAMNRKSKSDAGINEPRFTWQHHSAKVTDISVTNGGRCITTSIDKSINIYSYASGERLHCVASWPSPIWSIVMNKNETKLFLGGQDGNIYELAISSLSLSLMDSKNKKDETIREPILTGHKDRVSHLLISMDGSLLISGSHDSTCKIWDIYQGKLIRDIKHQAPIANLVTMIVPDAFALTSMTQSQTKPPFLVKQLKRNLYKLPRDASVSKEDLFDESSTTLFYLKNKHDSYKQEFNSNKRETSIDKNANDSGASQTEDNQLIVKELKAKLKELYVLSTEKIFKDVALESLQPIKKIKR